MCLSWTNTPGARLTLVLSTMKTPRIVSTSSAASLLASALLAVALLNPSPAWAQAAAPNAATLAKYDKNNNGRLDPDEIAAMQADEAKAAQAPVATAPSAPSSDIVTLNPFEVDASKDIGYYAE